ncbi:MAG: MMPL family transporter [Pseudomonadales bacterium]|nr:MMPL family transporter [Pseudomonadales bacterium]
MSQFFEVIYRHRWKVLFTYLLMAFAILAGVPRLTMDNSADAWFDSESDVMELKRKFEREFGSTNDIYLVYAPADGDVFSEKSLASLQAVHNSLSNFMLSIDEREDSQLGNITGIRSLINEKVTEANADTIRSYEFIGKQLPSTDAERQALREQALSNPDFIERFISQDGQFGGIFISTKMGLEVNDAPELDETEEISFDEGFNEFETGTETESEESLVREKVKANPGVLMQEIRELVNAANTDAHFTVYYAGQAELSAFIGNALKSEVPLVFGSTFLLIIMVLLAIFRSLSAVIWPLLVIIFSLGCTLGLAGWFGIPLSSLANPLMLLIIVISVADAVHILAACKHHRQNGDSAEVACSTALAKTGMACFVTSVTTIAGFLSMFLLVNLVPVANFGLLASIGIAIAFISSVTLLPVLMSIWPPVSRKKSFDKQTEPAKSAFLARYFDMISRHPATILGGGFAILAVLSYGVNFIKIDTNTLEQFSENTSIRQAFEVADTKMAGTQNIDIMLEFGQEDAFYDPRVLQAIGQFQTAFENEFPAVVTGSTSIVNVLKSINQRMQGGEVENYQLPLNQGEIGNYLYLFNNSVPEERRRFIADNFETGRIGISIRNSGSSQFTGLLASLEQRIISDLDGPLKPFYPDMRVSVTGGVVFSQTLNDVMARSQIKSFALAFLTITVILLLVFGSLKIGLIAMIPNLLPIAATYGIMGWIGVPLDNFTMIIAPIVLGIVVDDTVHLVLRLKQNMAEGLEIVQAMYKTLFEVSRALCITSLVLAISLMSMFNSSINSIASFGYLSAIAIIIALLADLLLVPAVCVLSTRFKPENQSSGDTVKS